MLQEGEGRPTVHGVFLSADRQDRASGAWAPSSVHRWLQVKIAGAPPVCTNTTVSSLVRRPAPGVRDHAGRAFARVHGVEDERLGAGEQLDRLLALRAGLAVAGAHEVVEVDDSSGRTETSRPSAPAASLAMAAVRAGTSYSRVAVTPCMRKPPHSSRASSSPAWPLPQDDM